VAGRAVANHADVERVQHAEDLFANTAGFRQVITNDRHQREVLFHFHTAE
jgi:hypothetical protein